MPKLKVNPDVSNVPSWEDLRKFSSELFRSIIDEFNGRISLTENLQTSRLEFTFSSANQEIGLLHGLGFTPNGYITIKNSTGVVVFDASENTKETLYLKATGAGTVTVLVF